MLDRNNPYYRQVELVMRVLPLVARESRFALKGGTAINLFVHDLPRLSVDIDLTYLPLGDRDTALVAIENGLQSIADNVGRVIRGASINSAPAAGGRIQRLQISAGGVSIKIEVSPVLRGSVLGARELGVADSVADQFGYVETRVIEQDELYAGKLVAALDRQHPRDLFDVMMLLESDGISPDLIDIFIIYLVSSNRPIAELLSPNLQPLQPVFDQQFRGMSLRETTVDELDKTRETMIATIKRMLTKKQKAFLISFKHGEPEWSLIRYSQAQELPAVRWKLENIKKLDRTRRDKAISKLEHVLSN